MRSTSNIHLRSIQKLIVASNRSRIYNVCETAILVFASEAEISDSDVDMPLSASKNEVITYDDSSDEEEGTTTECSRNFAVAML